MLGDSPSVPDLGVGVGLRVPHYRAIFEERPVVDFFEVISENFMVGGGKPLNNLDRIVEAYRVVPHGVALGIGSPEPPDRDYLMKLKALVRRTRAPWVSDHLCWCGAGGAHLQDLLPLPYSAEVATLVAERARMIQDILEVPFALENTSSYLEYGASAMTEWQFVAEVVEQANVGILFDVNNAYVNAYNHGTDAAEFVRMLPARRVFQIHLAGHTNFGAYIIDTHRGPPIDAVWDLYRQTIRHTGPVSTLVEWDDEIPPLSVVLTTAEKARAIRNEALHERRETATADVRPTPCAIAPAARTPEVRRGEPVSSVAATQGQSGRRLGYLRETQEWMASMLRRRGTLGQDPSVVARAAEQFAGREGLSAVEQLEIYRRQFWLRHTASLLEDFSGLAGIVGQAQWERLVESYLEEIAPTSWTLRDLGSRMPAHVERSTWLAHQALCVDMARLEWDVVELFDAPDVPPLDTSKLSAIAVRAAVDARVLLRPDVFLLKVRYPVVELRRRLHMKEPVVLPSEKPENLVLSRDAAGHFESTDVDDAAFALLAALREGDSLGTACERAASSLPPSAEGAPRRVSEFFADFARHGWIADVRAA